MGNRPDKYYHLRRVDVHKSGLCRRCRERLPLVRTGRRNAVVMSRTARYLQRRLAHDRGRRHQPEAHLGQNPAVVVDPRRASVGVSNETVLVGGYRHPMLLAIQASVASLSRAITGGERAAGGVTIHGR